jgi:hypothetical protein
MELNGAFSNPFETYKSLLGRLSDLHQRLLERAVLSPRRPRRAPPKRVPVLETVTQVLEQAGEPMRARAIHAAAERRLGEPLRWSSVRGVLSAYTIGGDGRFRRIGHGRYELTRAL